MAGILLIFPLICGGTAGAVVGSILSVPVAYAPTPARFAISVGLIAVGCVAGVSTGGRRELTTGGGGGEVSLLSIVAVATFSLVAGLITLSVSGILAASGFADDPRAGLIAAGVILIPMGICLCPRLVRALYSLCQNEATVSFGGNHSGSDANRKEKCEGDSEDEEDPPSHRSPTMDTSGRPPAFLDVLKTPSGEDTLGREKEETDETNEKTVGFNRKGIAEGSSDDSDRAKGVVEGGVPLPPAPLPKLEDKVNDQDEEDQIDKEAREEEKEEEGGIEHEDGNENIVPCD